MRALLYGLVVAGIAGMASPVWAATVVADAAVGVDVPPKTIMFLGRPGTCCVGRGTAASIVFDQYDFDDRPGGDPNLMYAPYISETDAGLNWHAVRLWVNSSWTLEATVEGTAGPKPLADIMQFFCNDELFFPVNSSGFPPRDPFGCGGGIQDTWQFLNGFVFTVDTPFVGDAFMNYRLKVDEVPAGAHAGEVTYTLTSF